MINLSLKSAKQPNYDMAYDILINEIRQEFDRHSYILKGDGLNKTTAEKYESILQKKATPGDYATSLAFLSKYLEKYHGMGTIILIDEYDVPLENAYFEGFYNKMTRFIRSLFESALKTNKSLAFGVVTGCLRISRESIFTGLNNLKIVSVLSNDYAECFGFTPVEVKEILTYYGIKDKAGEVKEWYDGYLFGESEVYNPWSVINYVDDNRHKSNVYPKPYWSNTSSNSIIRELVEGADFITRREIEDLMEGNTIEKPVHEDITYEDIHESQNNLWNFLFFTGYLKKAGEKFEGEALSLEMEIPNAEIRYIYKNTILSWFDKKIRNSDMMPLITAMERRDCQAIGNFLSEQLLDAISIYDYAGNYYHGFILGILKAAGKYIVRSNKETENGRADILMYAPHGQRQGIYSGI